MSTESLPFSERILVCRSFTTFVLDVALKTESLGGPYRISMQGRTLRV